MLECANGCNQVVFHLQAVADLIKANGLPSHISLVLHRRKGFFMKKDRLRQWKTSPKELGFRGSQSPWIHAGPSFSHCQCTDLGAEQMVGVQQEVEVVWDSPGSKSGNRRTFGQSPCREVGLISGVGKLLFLFQRKRSFCVYFVKKMDCVKENSSFFVFKWISKVMVTG